MLNKFFNNKIKSSLFLALYVYIFLNILTYFFHWEQNKNDLEKFDKTNGGFVKSNENSDKQLVIIKLIQDYGMKTSIALIPMSLFIGFLQFIAFKSMYKRSYKNSDSQAEIKKDDLLKTR